MRLLICIFACGVTSLGALDMKFETCGLGGIWAYDKVLAKGLDENNRKLVECALTAKKHFAAISDNKFCRENNCIFSAKDDAMIDFMISHARKEQLAASDKQHGPIYTVLGKVYTPGKNDHYMKKWIKKIRQLGISSEEAHDRACWQGQRDLYFLLGKPKTTEGRFSVGQEIGVKTYDFAGKIQMLCKHGATVLRKDSTQTSWYRYDEMLTLDEKKAENQRFAEQRRINEEKRARKKTAGSQPPESSFVDDPKRDKRHDLPAGRLVKVRSTAFKEKADTPNMHAVCETKTVMRKMPDGYYRGSIHCGGSAYYTYTVGVEIEEIREKAPEKPSYNVRKCIEDCLAKCGRPRLGEAPSYGNTVCTQGCKPSCESTWRTE